MRLVSSSLVVVLACSAPKPASVTVPVASGSSPPPVTVPSRECALRASPLRMLDVPPAVMALAPQYFHAGTTDPILDLIAGTSSYAFYDPETFAGVIPPPPIQMIRRATKTYFFGWGGQQAFVAKRDDRTAIALPSRLFDVDFVEDARGRAFLLTSPADPAVTANVMLTEISSGLEAHERSVVALPGVDAWDRRVAVTADGSVVVAWVERSDHTLVVVASWLDARGFHDAYIVDRVDVPEEAVELSLRTTTTLRVVPEGRDRVAVAWRPIVPRKDETLDVGSRSRPPEHDASAEVRILTTDARHASSTPRVHATRAGQLGFTTGIGPWPLDRNGLEGTTASGHAAFVWLEESGVVMAGVRDERPIVVAPRFGRPRLLPLEPKPRGTEVLVLRAGGPQNAFTITCEP
jgi:hypothetical protein